MRTLIYIPIIHSGADMGSMAADLARKGINEFGIEFWESHVQTVNSYWDVIGRYCDHLAIDRQSVRIYQDGMVVDGEIAMKIMEDSIKAGSKNYAIVSGLIAKGAVIMQTEDLALVKKEVGLLKSMPSSGSTAIKLLRLLILKFNRARLLKQRDIYIAGRITETLRDDETGILFLGAYHNILDKLPEDIEVVEFKSIKKVREYQKLLSFHSRKGQTIEELSRYLVRQETSTICR